MQRIARLPRRSPRTTLTLLLVLGLVAAFAVAVYLSYWGSENIRNAFAYQSAVVTAQKDSQLLEVERFERRKSDLELRPYDTLLKSDLAKIDAIAESGAERSPPFSFGGNRNDYEALTTELLERQRLAEQRFEATVTRNRSTRDRSNALFALIALLFAVLLGRLRRVVEEGRSLVERLGAAFISKNRVLPNVDLGSVLISATQGSNVGGDTHDAFTLDRRHAMFLVADVSGKGIDAAVDTALIKYTMRTLFSQEQDPGVILKKFGSLYSRTTENPETFVVLFLAVADLEEGTVRYASAGHEPAWAMVGGDVVQLPASGPIIGIDPDADYDTHELHLRHGDALVISTDGLTESRDARGRLLGSEGVIAWLRESGGTAQAIADRLVRRLRGRSRRITDDLAVLVVRYTPRLPASAE